LSYAKHYNMPTCCFWTHANHVEHTQVAYGADMSDKWHAGKKPEIIKV